ncbi:YfkD family protein [Halobacillus massiliensis]|uniref:YfkD family protein n=1 Tax=Halobacillus massiliensis TaxID=1926286 RepID=UPI00117A4410|nr:YfkD family protein [Halobacillus massiliensis]
MKSLGFIIFISFLLFSLPFHTVAKEKHPHIPSHVLNISKDNTFPNSTEQQEILEAEDLTGELIYESEVPVVNPELIKMLNGSTIKPSPIAIGYRGEIFLGRWPLSYSSKESNINWEYQQINTNELNNQVGRQTEEISYLQQEEKTVNGGLTTKSKESEQIMRLILLEAQSHSKLPLSYKAVIGRGTEQPNKYAVPVDKVGQLKAFAPALNEKGEVAFGDVYIKLKGSKKMLEIKNVTRQNVGAWIPVQDHVSFSYELH